MQYRELDFTIVNAGEAAPILPPPPPPPPDGQASGAGGMPPPQDTTASWFRVHNLSEGSIHVGMMPNLNLSVVPVKPGASELFPACQERYDLTQWFVLSEFPMTHVKVSVCS